MHVYDAFCRYTMAYENVMLEKLPLALIQFRACHSDKSTIDEKVYAQNAPKNYPKPPKTSSVAKYQGISEKEAEASLSYYITPLSNLTSVDDLCKIQEIKDAFADSDIQKCIDREFNTRDLQLLLKQQVTAFRNATSDKTNVEAYSAVCEMIGSAADPFAIPRLTLDGLALDDSTKPAADILAGAFAKFQTRADSVKLLDIKAAEYWLKNPFKFQGLSPLFFYKVPNYM